MKNLFRMMSLVGAYMILTTIVISCDKDKDDEPTTDTSAPVVNLHEMTSTTVNAGESVTLLLQFTDNEGLSQARLEIHPADDGHSHRVSAEPFTWVKILDISGNRVYADSIEVQIPADAASGPMHFNVELTDASGNEADISVLEFDIENSSMPQITLTSPTNNEHFSLNDVVNFVGMIEDADGIEELIIEVENEETETVYYDFDKELNGATSYDLSNVNTEKPLSFPSGSAELGEYHMHIQVHDVNENISEIELHLHVE